VDLGYGRDRRQEAMHPEGYRVDDGLRRLLIQFVCIHDMVPFTLKRRGSRRAPRSLSSSQLGVSPRAAIEKKIDTASDPQLAPGDLGAARGDAPRASGAGGRARSDGAV